MYITAVTMSILTVQYLLNIHKIQHDPFLLLESLIFYKNLVLFRFLFKYFVFSIFIKTHFSKPECYYMYISVCKLCTLCVLVVCVV